MRLTLPPTSPAKDVVRHPLLTGPLSRWVWRFYTQRLTRAGRWLTLPTGAFLFYGGISLELQGYVVFSYVMGLWAVAWVAMLIYRPRARLSAAHAPRVCAGETLPVDVDVEQVGRLRGADLFVLPHRLPPEVDAEPEQGAAVGDLDAGEAARVRVGLRCRRRGAYTLRGFRVETGFPFGILRARRVFAEQRELLVYPKFTRLARLNLPVGRRYHPGGVALTSSLGESFEFLGNREYREGDNVRDIDWRATARAMRPIVREHRDEYLVRVAVILDTQVHAKVIRGTPDRQEAFERAVSVSAAVGDYMAGQDYLVDLFAAGPNLYHLTAGRSLAYLDQILDILACVQSTPAHPFETIEPELYALLSKITTVVCVLLDWDEPRRAFVHRLAAEGAGVKVVVVRDGPCTLDPAVERDVVGHVTVLSSAEVDAGVEEL
jgi:uncharacterized protein (DUF58 family)